jgi:peptidoglycan hydrolase FlgJ
MMTDAKTMMSVGTYTDFKEINDLHHQINSDPAAAKKEVAEQFESLLVQMLMKSMREANEALASDPSASQQSALYMDLFDKQLSLVVSHAGTGFAKMVEESLERVEPQQGKPTAAVIEPAAASKIEEKINNEAAENSLQTVQKAAIQAPFGTTADFVKTLWSSAKTAASVLGADPKFLLAQAALETNWGKNILSLGTGKSSHNLFNIKADSSWEAASVQVNALEQENGVMVKNKSKFRAYESFNDSFNDYVHFLKNNSRYNEALKHASDPQQFAQQLQKANYATDEKYSEKIMQIYSSKRFNDMIANQKLI